MSSTTTALHLSLTFISQPVIVIRMLTGTLTNPGTAMTIGARDTILRGLEVGALLGASRTNRGSLALNAIHLWSDYKAATGDILFPQERLDAYLAFVDRCIFPAFQQLGGVFDGDTSAEALVGTNDGGMPSLPCFLVGPTLTLASSAYPSQRPSSSP